MRIVRTVRIISKNEWEWITNHSRVMYVLTYVRGFQLVQIRPSHKPINELATIFALRLKKLFHHRATATRFRMSVNHRQSRLRDIFFNLKIRTQTVYVCIKLKKNTSIQAMPRKKFLSPCVSRKMYLYSVSDTTIYTRKRCGHEYTLTCRIYRIVFLPTDRSVTIKK